MAASPRHVHVFHVPKTHLNVYAEGVATHQRWELYRSSHWRHRPEVLVFLRVASGFTLLLLYVAVLSVAVGLYYQFGVNEKKWPFFSSSGLQVRSHVKVLSYACSDGLETLAWLPMSTPQLI